METKMDIHFFDRKIYGCSFVFPFIFQSSSLVTFRTLPLKERASPEQETITTEL